MTWLLERAPGETPLQEVLGLRPELASLLDDYLAQAWADHDPVVLELCRLRIAKLHGDAAQQRLRHDSAMAAGLTEDKVAALADYHRSPHYSEHERACLNYAEQYVIDVHSITDDDAATVKQGMTDAEFVSFTVALGLFDGIGRLRLALGVDDASSPAPAVEGGATITVPTPSAGHPAH